MKINESLFKEYDIRGIYPEEINADAAYHIASGFVEFLNAEKLFGPVLVGRDVRLSSPELHNAFIQGILDQGRDATDIGIATTPLFYFSVVESGTAGGAMITASHNPKEYNGIKFVKEGAIAVNKESGLPAIRAFSFQDRPRKFSQGQRFLKDFSQKYVDFLLSKADIARNIKFLIDASNGSAGAIAQRLLSGLDVEARPLFFTSDGNFPNHPPDPLHPKSIEVAGRAVVDTACEFGVIIDGDGDRIVFLNENGKVTRADIVGAFIADHVVKPGDAVITPKTSTKQLGEVVSARGGRLEFSRMGHSYVKKAMREQHAVFGVEHTGHMYFRDFYYADSSLLALVMFLSFFSRTSEEFSKTMSLYHTYVQVEANFKVANRDAMLGMLKKIYQDGLQDEFDGITVQYPDWWFNARLSNTEPLLRLTIEARTKELLEEKRKELEEKITQ